MSSIIRGPRKDRSNTARPAAQAPKRRMTFSRDQEIANLNTFEAALSATERVLRLDGPADALLSAFFREQSKLGVRDRAVVAETVFCVLRRKSEFSQNAQSGIGPMQRRLALQGMAECGHKAAADLLKRSATPEELEWLERIASIDRNALPVLVRTSFPQWIADRLAKRVGAERFETLANALNSSAPLDLRVNLLKAKRDEVLAEVQRLAEESQMSATETPYAPLGIRISGKPPLQRWPLFEDGTLEVQDEGSQLLAELVAPKRGDMVADFCAGAGGKSLALGALMRSTGRLYAMDISEKRLAKFKPRMAKSGLSNVQTMVLDSERDSRLKRLVAKFDRVLVDAPCSGLGTLRRNPDLKWRQHEGGLAELNEKQGSILASAARLVKPGGRLIYATCSLLREENEAVVDAFLAAHPTFTRVPVNEILASRGIALTMPGDDLQMWPDEHGTDGFYAAVLVAAAEEKKPKVKAPASEAVGNDDAEVVADKASEVVPENPAE